MCAMDTGKWLRPTTAASPITGTRRPSPNPGRAAMAWLWLAGPVGRVVPARGGWRGYLRGVKNPDPPPGKSAMPQPGLTPLELAQDLVARTERGNDYARSR